MGHTRNYTPPKVWTWDQESGGKFANINRPHAGPTHDRSLEIGRHPLQLYSLATPNGVKATIMLEELLEAGHAEAEYDAWLIRIERRRSVRQRLRRGEPQLQDPGAGGPQRPRSGAGLRVGRDPLYLAEKFGAFLPERGRCTRDMLTWLFWQMGSAPYLGGGFGHFYAYAPEKFEYPINRFTMETKRQLDVLDRRLRQQRICCRAPTSVSPTWRSGPGTACWRGANSMMPESSCRSRSITTFSAGPSRSAPDRRCSGVTW